MKGKKARSISGFKVIGIYHTKFLRRELLAKSNSFVLVYIVDTKGQRLNCGIKAKMS